MEFQEREEKKAKRRARRKRQVLFMRCIMGVLIAAVLVTGAILVKTAADKKSADGGAGGSKTLQGETPGSKAQEDETKGNGAGRDTTDVPDTSGQGEEPGEDAKGIEAMADAGAEELMAEADRLAAMYDYDRAVSLLKSYDGYSGDTRMQAKAEEYGKKKAACQEYPLEEITHIFYHSLVVSPARAFAAGDATSRGINQVMTTVDEFNKITQSMYEKGYVLVNLKDMVTFDENGNAVKGKIMLPPGKIPFVLSQDDVSYYHYQEGYGMADRLVLDENGEVKAAYTEDDGTVSIGDYDMVPLIDSFVKEHPDFSYRGAKGTLAMTGYNGVLGYHTDIDYKVKENLLPDQEEWLNAHPEFDYDADVEQAKKVAEAMKENGWVFASHTWGHKNVADAALDEIKTDTEKWKSYVEPILGPTNIIIFAFGADIGGAQPYTTENTNGKFDYLKSQGFDIYCNVDSQKYFVQFGENFMRQGRRNLDGYRMYYNPELLEDLFDAQKVFDPARPTPVPEINPKS